MSTWSDPARKALLKKLWADGLSAQHVAAHFPGVTRSAVLGAVHRYGLAHRSTVRRPKPQRAKRKPASVYHHQPTVEFPAEPCAPLRGDVFVPHAERKSILDLDRGDCRWPIGDPGHPDFHFCNGRQEPGQSYCAHHVSIAYAAPVPATRTRHAHVAPLANPVREMEDA